MRHADDTLEAYLARIASGERVQAPEPGMESLVRVAQRLHQVSTVQPSPASVERIRVALRRVPVREVERRSSAPRLGLWRRPVTGLAFAVVLMALGTSSALAAPSALPDSPLYPVRNMREAVQVKLAGNPALRAKLYATFAGERAMQLGGLVHKAVAPGLVATLLRDIESRVHQANQEARADGPDALSAVREVEGQIGNQLTEIQQQGEFSGDDAAQLTDTLRAVQSEQSGQSGDSSNGTTGATGTNGTNGTNGTTGANGTNGHSDSNQPDAASQ
ncbi:MAG: DUF5667 domain-containing protein [Candidatus Dormibacteraeota bacterium]|nr:DUF5667 domain-containing protein [Candidatus Dormibacteraeota bacterium]